jgi:hypothetical protein
MPQRKIKRRMAKPGYRMIILIAPPLKSLPPQKHSRVHTSSFYYSTAYSVHSHRTLPPYNNHLHQLFQLFLYLYSLLLPSPSRLAPWNMTISQRPAVN